QKTSRECILPRRVGFFSLHRLAATRAKDRFLAIDRLQKSLHRAVFGNLRPRLRRFRVRKNFHAHAANLREDFRGHKGFFMLPSPRAVLSALCQEPDKIPRAAGEGKMKEPIASRPYWPDALEKPADSTKGLKPWSWAVARLEKSHNYW